MEALWCLTLEVAENPISLTLFLMSLGGFGGYCPNDDGRDQTWLCLTCEPK